MPLKNFTASTLLDDLNAVYKLTISKLKLTIKCCNLAQDLGT